MIPGAGGGLISPGRHAALHALAVDRTTAATWRRLTGEGIELVLLKGPSVAEWLYDDPDQRSYADTDLLVPPDRFEEAVALLRSDGMVPTPGKIPNLHAPTSVEVTLVDPATGVEVDLHRSILGLEAPADDVWRAWRPGAVPLHVGGIEVLAPSECCRLLHIVLHAAFDQNRKPRSAEDLRRALATCNPDEWRDARGLAAELDGLAMMRVGLELEPDGRELIDALDLGLARSTLSALLTDGGFHEAQAGAFLSSDVSVATKVAWLLRRAAPPVSDVRRWGAARGLDSAAAGYLSWWRQGLARLGRVLRSRHEQRP